MKGEIIKKLRTEKGLTQEELAKRLSISPSTIAMIESNKRAGSRAVEEKISNFFGVSRDFLAGATENKDLYKKSNNSGMIDEFLNELIEDGIITDSNTIDNEISQMIINAVKAQIALKLKKIEKGNKK